MLQYINMILKDSGEKDLTWLWWPIAAMRQYNKSSKDSKDKEDCKDIKDIKKQ